MSTSDTVAVSTVPSREELVQRARDLQPMLWDNAAQSDRDRVLSHAEIDAVAQAGLFKLAVPKRLGGYETDTRTLLEVLAQLGKGNLSTAWVTGVLNFAAWQVGMFTEQAQRDVFENDPDARLCWVLSAAIDVKPADGGIVVNGKWANGSGSAHADWAALGLPTSFGPHGPELSMALVPIGELTIEDTWQIVGVRGSASNTVVAQDVFIPEHRLLPMAPAMAGVTRSSHPEETLYRSAWSLGGTVLLAPQLGVATALLELVLEASRGKMIPAVGVMDQSEWVTFQMEVADAATRIDAAWMLARRNADEIDAAAQRGELPDDLTRTRLRSEQAWASNQLKEAAETLMTEAGVSAYFDESPLQRLWRDLTVAHAHTAFRLRPVQETYGKALLGKDVGPIFMG